MVALTLALSRPAWYLSGRQARIAAAKCHRALYSDRYFKKLPTPSPGLTLIYPKRSSFYYTLLSGSAVGVSIVGSQKAVGRGCWWLSGFSPPCFCKHSLPSHLSHESTDLLQTKIKSTAGDMQSRDLPFRILFSSPLLWGCRHHEHILGILETA